MRSCHLCAKGSAGEIVRLNHKALPARQASGWRDIVRLAFHEGRNLQPKVSWLSQCSVAARSVDVFALEDKAADRVAARAAAPGAREHSSGIRANRRRQTNGQ